MNPGDLCMVKHIAAFLYVDALMSRWTHPLFKGDVCIVVAVHKGHDDASALCLVRGIPGWITLFALERLSDA